MKYSIVDFLTLVGSLGFFLYGMKIMSESLQKVAGDKMRSILAKMTSNPVKGVLTGLLITAIIQSSSATTVMVVSFVNAGLLSLIESIGVIMGANIGTTVTAWLISLLGFKVNISIISLPLIGLGFPLLFSSNNKRKSWGEFIIGFAMIFLGLDFLKDSVPDIKSHPEILSFLADFTSQGVWSHLLFLSIGTILTMIIQSSSATMALTLVMCNNGWISFDIAAAMVLGENIGTTITANLAAAVANVSAKRAARAHFIFNLLGVIWVSMFFPFFLNLINNFVIKIGGTSPYEDPHAIPVALSIFHSAFNIANTFLFIWFTKLIALVVIKMVPQKEDSEEFRLQYIQTGLLSTSELSIHQAKKEILVYAQRVEKMFSKVEEMFTETSEKKFYKLYDKVEKYEGISDRMEVEIANYLTKISEGELSNLGSKRIKAQLTIVSELESVADCCYNLAKTLRRKRDNKVSFDQKLSDNIRKMMNLVMDSIIEMQKNLDHGYTKINIVQALEMEQAINNYRDRLKKEHLKDLEKQDYDYKTGVIYSDLFSECEKCADYVINVSEAIEGINKD
ncbi:MAG: Na/Pi cotransporter [Bacteroidetes bacterium GWF2_33_16]|nr:MAG: Na/Pi cotransporter [Bacteroidetes bacterium GWE2_32_14]OFY03483.1 MAG: Na/Pi cotransporter [Bacteroidetes bacterium GWF2_33_16]